jgi:hypothetical protein
MPKLYPSRIREGLSLLRVPAAPSLDQFKKTRHYALRVWLFDAWVSSANKLEMRNTTVKRVDKSLVLPFGQWSVFHEALIIY